MTRAVDRLPHRRLPLYYFAAAHAALILALLALALDPRGAAGFFYHARMLAIVHLVTLGWITTSILGSLYLVGPIALGIAMPVTRLDYTAFAIVVIGITGMVTHFWMASYSGMAWAAGTATVGILIVVSRTAWRLRASPMPPGVLLHIRLASLNIAIAATMGVLLGIDKVTHVLPGFVLTNVFAHAHMAAIGWATMMVVGVGYRLIPMVLPAQPPTGRSLFISAILLETGVLGLLIGLLRQSSLTRLFGAVVVCGLAAFAAHVGWMLRHRLRRPAAAPAIDFTHVHAVMGGVWLLCSIGLGLFLLRQPMSDALLRAALAYGVCGLLGFLAQMVVAMQTRLLPPFRWYHLYADSEYRTVPPSPWTMRDRPLQWMACVAWAVGVPAIALGLSQDGVGLLATGAWTLLAGVLLTTFDHLRVLGVLAGVDDEPRS